MNKRPGLPLYNFEISRHTERYICASCRDLLHVGKTLVVQGKENFLIMKNRAKARFNGVMRFIRCNEDALRKDSLAKKNCCVKMISLFGRKSS